MQIHTMKPGESPADVAIEYGVSEDSIRINNGIEDISPAVGEELLILTPTRTYTVKRGDTPERLALRFGVGKRELMALNPHICDRGLVPGAKIALKYDEPTLGMGVANGYFYKGCSLHALKRALPYLTYITVAAAVAEGDKVSRLFDDEAVIAEALASSKIPLLRIYDRDTDRSFGDKAVRERYADSLIEAVQKKNYRGIVLSEAEDRDGYSDFLVDLRRRMIGCDLILLTEMSEKSPKDMNEYADGSLLSYDKYGFEAPPTFAEGEKKVYADFACDAESSKTFISLPAMARWGRGYCTIEDALSTARQYGCEIKRDDETLLCSFTSARRGDFVYSSLKNVKATLELISEYGFMGISFDIMRAPISHLLMYNNLYRTAYHTNVRAPEGCSGRDGSVTQ